MKKRFLALTLAITLTVTALPTMNLVQAQEAEIIEQVEETEIKDNADTSDQQAEEEKPSVEDSVEDFQEADALESQPSEETKEENTEENIPDNTEESIPSNGAGTEQEELLPITTQLFPDTAFYNYVLENIDTDSDGNLSESEIVAVTQLNVLGLGITNLTGIEVFTELISLDCSNNGLAELDVTDLTKLETLTCSNNSLDVVADGNNQFTLPFTVTDSASRIQNLTGATLSGITFTAKAESVSYSYDAGNGFVFQVQIHVSRFKKDISGVMVAAIPNVVYTGKAICPKLSITYNGKAVSDTDYTITYQNNVNAGTAYAVISGRNAYKGTKKAAFKILPKSITKFKYSKVKDYTYRAKSIKPGVTVKNGSRKLIKNKDYTISYKDNKKIGKATITIKGKGNYTGTKKITFRILPQKVTPLKCKSKSAASIKLQWKKSPTVTGYQIYQYHSKKRKYYKVKTVKTNSTTITKLSDCTNYRFKVRAYKKIGKKTYYGDYSKAITVTTLLSTPTLYASSSRIGQAVVQWGSVNKASQLELYYKAGNDKYKKLGTLSNRANTLYMAELQVGAVYTFRMRAVKTVNGKNVYSNYATKAVVISAAGSSLVGGNYTPGCVYGPALTQAELEQVRASVQYFKDHYIDDSMPDVMKVKIAHDYLCRVTSYAPDWSKNRANTAWGALVYGQAQCSGYARAMKALCDGIGIGCYYVHADANALNPSHQWNEVCVNGNWYIVDVQCNDSSGFYAYFLVSDYTYASTSGMSWDRSIVPACPYDY